ncbi:MAG: cytochrome c biogenesis CcdA family protein [Burkholderiales bacterium]
MSLGVTEIGLGVVAGSLSTLSPCVFPLLPLVVGGATQASRFTPVWMATGMTLSFALGGMVLGTVGAQIGIDGDVLRIAGAYLMLLMAVVLWSQFLSNAFSQLVTPVANWGNQLSGHLQNRVPGNGALSSVLLGALLGMIWSPCSGPLLASALTLVASEGGALRGGVILGGFGLGAAVPLMLVAYASRNSMGRARGWLMSHGGQLKKVFAGVIGLCAVAVLLGLDKRLEAALVTVMPDWWVALTTRY